VIIGLMKGVDRFQYRRGFRFATYATWSIGEDSTLGDFLEDTSTTSPTEKVRRDGRFFIGGIVDNQGDFGGCWTACSPAWAWG